MKTLALVLLAAGYSSAPPPVRGEELVGRVLAVSDGDTVTFEAGADGTPRRYKVRLGQIDAPETKQPYGAQAKSELASLVSGRELRVVPSATDRYGRVVGAVSIGVVDVSAELVKRGAAWVYRQYSRSPDMTRLEGEAKAAARGLWALPSADQVPPWVWRKQHKGVAPPAHLRVR